MKKQIIIRMRYDELPEPVRRDVLINPPPIPEILASIINIPKESIETNFNP